MIGLTQTRTIVLIVCLGVTAFFFFAGWAVIAARSGVERLRRRRRR